MAMSKTKTAEIIEGGGNHLEEQRRIDKSLAPFSDNLPYDRERVIQYGKFQLEQGFISFYELGKCLLLLHEHEDGPTLARILEDHFGDMPVRTAKYYMRFARFAGQFPRFRAIFERPGMLHKGLALLEGLQDPEAEAKLQELEDTGLWGDLTESDILDKSVRELKRENKKLREQMEEGKTKSEKENRKLKDEVAALKALVKGPDLDEAWKVADQAERKFREGADLLERIPGELLQQNSTLRDRIFTTCNMLDRMRATVMDAAQEALVKAEMAKEVEA